MTAPVTARGRAHAPVKVRADLTDVPCRRPPVEAREAGRGSLLIPRTSIGGQNKVLQLNGGKILVRDEGHLGPGLGVQSAQAS